MARIVRPTSKVGAAVCAVALAAGCSQDSSGTAQAATGPYVTAAKELVADAVQAQTFAELKPKTAAPPFQPGKRIAGMITRIAKRDVEWVCSGAGSEYAGWGVVDELNRAFNKQPPAGNRVPVQLVNQDNYAKVTTPSAGFTGGFDYEAAWKQYWGVG